MSFTANISDSGELFWIPTRQVLRDLSADLANLGNLVLPGDYTATNLTEPDKGAKRPAYNNSLETILQREGPSIGAQMNCFLGNITAKILGPDKQVRCFDNYGMSGNSSYTKCYKFGLGWDGSNEVAQFYLGDATSASNETLVWVYTSDKATYFNQTTDFGSGIEKCLEDDSGPCDWDQIFDTALDPQLRNTSVNPLVTEYFSPLYAVDGFVDTRIYCDAIVYNSFPTYSVDTSQTANPLQLATMNGLPSEDDKRFNTTPIAVNPDWVLAAWSVENNGTVDSTRLVGREMASVVGPNYYLDWAEDLLPEEFEEFAFLHIYSMTQSLSLIDYDYTNDTTSFSSKPLNQAHPVFKKWATLRVWAYGLSDRTPKLGVVVCILGCLCVFFRLGLALALRIRHEHSTVELFVAALEHHPTHEFDHLDDEAKMAKVRYILEDSSGKPRFVSERVHSGNLGGP